MSDMDRLVSAAVSTMPDEITLPRENGELVFASPWEARVFGLAVALHEEGSFSWQLFSQSLAEEITTAERNAETSTYYERWLRALRRVTTTQDLLASQEIADRSERVRRDHEHEHDHDGGHTHQHQP